MKKAAFILSIVLLALAACNNSNGDSSENADDPNATTRAVGSEKDVHGCLVSAGETWSQLQQNCIQVFNVAQRLNPVGAEDGDAVISAFVLMNENRSKAELFMANDQGNTTIMEKSEGDVYENGEYKFDSGESALYINGEKKYIGNVE